MDDDKPLRDPARVKALSYARDCRNAYGNSDKAARKAIPARKAGENRKARRKAVHALSIIQRGDEAAAALTESSLLHDVERVGGWTKGADMPLGEIVANAKDARIARHGRKSRPKYVSPYSSDLLVAAGEALLIPNLPVKTRLKMFRSILKRG